MSLKQCVPAVRSLIQNAATKSQTVSFPQLFRLFPSGTPEFDVYNTLEAACADLANWKAAIYSVVMSKSVTGLPGDGFFDIFRNHRETEYTRIAGNTHIANLSLEQKIEMVKIERSTVYAHAKL